MRKATKLHRHQPIRCVELSLILSIMMSFAYGQTLQGTILSGGQPLEKVTISVLHSSIEPTYSDENGFFKLEDLPHQKIQVSYSRNGFKTVIETYDFKIHRHWGITVNMEIDATLFEEIAIVGDKIGLTENTPYTISRLDLKEINFKGQPSGVMGQIQREPGVNAADMGHGIVKPFIRGLGFSRVATIYQGNKLENHQWGADHGLGINDLGISSVDIVKGPASILYGSGALGGVILLNDDETYLLDQKLHGTFGSTLNTVSMGVRNYGTLSKSFKNGWFIAAEGAYETHADYFDGDNRLIGNSRFNTSTLRFHTGYQGEKSFHKLSYTYNNQSLGIIEDDEMEAGESLATFRSDRAMQLPFQRVQDQLVGYRQQYKINQKWSQELDLTYHYNQREEIEDDFNDVDLGLQQQHIFYNLRFKNEVNTHYTQQFGIQGSLLEMTNMKEAGEILFPNSKHIENGAYYLSTYTKSKHTLQGGMRIDYRAMRADANQENIIEEGYVLPGNPEGRTLDFAFFGATGSLGYTNTIDEKHRFNVNISSGFRSPDLAELLSNGPHPGTNRFEVGDVSFGNEQSWQTDIGWKYVGKQFRVRLSAFGNLINNYIFFTDSGDTTQSGLNIWEFKQSNAFLYGGEFDIVWKQSSTSKLKIELFGNIIRGYDRENNTPLTFIPADRIGTQINYKPMTNQKLNTFVRNQYIFAQNRPGIGEINTAGYNLLDAGISYSLNIKAHKLNFGVTCFNIFNQTYFDHISILRAFEITAPGRNVMVNVWWRI
jgi:iron complex outermembrane recepter protein